jgi:hypothetical protein
MRKAVKQLSKTLPVCNESTCFFEPGNHRHATVLMYYLWMLLACSSAQGLYSIRASLWPSRQLAQLPLAFESRISKPGNGFGF